MAAHWTEDLFLRHPEVFLAIHENAWSTGETQARDLHAILERFGVPPGRPDPRRSLRHRTAFEAPGENGLPDRRRGPVPGVRLARGRTRPPRGRGRSGDVPHRRPPASHGNGPGDRRRVRRGPQPLDIPRLLRRRDRRPDPPGVREACAPRRNPGHLYREPGLRRPALRPARLRDLREHRPHRTTTPGSRDLTNAERVAVLPPNRRGSGSYPDGAHRALYLQPPRVAPPPSAGRVASDGGVRRVQDGRAFDR